LIYETWGKHFTQEDVSDRTGLSLNTLTRLFKRQLGVDRQSLEYLFRAFGLVLTQAEFEIVVWRSLANAPPLEELLSSLLKFLMPLYGEDPIIPTTLDRQLSKLMQYLQSRRCLLLLDNAEIILHREQAGQWRSGYEGYGHLLRTIGETPHPSCLLLTSREKPREMALMEGEQALVRSLTLVI
jgi:transcriptional regulator with XRE-family HTH domain